MQQRISEDGIDLVAKWEGLELKAYLDGGGVPTIGYGTTRYFDLPGAPRVRMGDVIDTERARTLLEFTLDDFWGQVEPLIQVPLEQNHVDALCCFIYNIGVSAFSKSTLLRLLNKGDFNGAGKQFARWNQDNGKVVRGLTLRRADETDLWFGD